MQYTEFNSQGQPGVGMLTMPAEMPAHIASYWMPYFRVADCDASLAKATGLGAKVVVPPRTSRKPGASRSSAIRRARCSPSSRTGGH
jgi:predicted enzyme related to lactoylglutathione lyase